MGVKITRSRFLHRLEEVERKTDWDVTTFQTLWFNIHEVISVLAIHEVFSVLAIHGVFSALNIHGVISVLDTHGVISVPVLRRCWRALGPVSSCHRGIVLEEPEGIWDHSTPQGAPVSSAYGCCWPQGHSSSPNTQL